MMMTCRDCEPLEPRRLLSVVPPGDAVDVSDAKPLRSYDLAIAGTGEFMIARVVGEADPALDEVQVVRYSAAGAQVGGPVTIASGSSILRVAVSMDGDGDAVVAYDGDDGEFTSPASPRTPPPPRPCASPTAMKRTSRRTPAAVFS